MNKGRTNSEDFRWSRFAVHDEIGVGGKYGMRKEGHELVGMKERTEGQTSEEWGVGGAGVMLPPPVLAL